MNCYNLNKSASRPPRKCNPCLLYTKEGIFVREFESQRECSYFLEVDEGWVARAIKGVNSIIDDKYMVMLKEGEIEYKIEPFICNNLNIIYILDDKDNIVSEFGNIAELALYINKGRDRVEETKIAHQLHFIHKYKGYKIIYKEDFVYLNGYVNESLKTYKYILKYDYEGNLLECINNKYGLKFIGSQADNCKLNTRLLLLNRGDSLRVCQGKYVFIKSNEVKQHIKTNITIYSYYDLEFRKVYSFFKTKRLN